MFAATDALLIVDAQCDFMPGGALGVQSGDEIIPVLNSLAGKMAAAGLPVIASRDWHPPDHCSFIEQGGPWPQHCVAGTPGAEIDPRMQLPADTRVVDKAVDEDKEAYSALDDTGLDEWLRQRGVHRLIVGGLATDYCVLNTARDALEAGYDVVILEDAVRAVDAETGRHALDELRESGAVIATSAEVDDATR